MEINKEHINEILTFQGAYASKRKALSTGQKELEALSIKLKTLSEELVALRKEEIKFFDSITLEYSENYTKQLLARLPEILTK